MMGAVIKRGILLWAYQKIVIVSWELAKVEIVDIRMQY